MRKKKIKWLVILAASVTIVVTLAFYILGQKEAQQAEHYWWQEDPEIVRVSEKFKSKEDIEYNRKAEATLLFPIIKIGASKREVEALLGKPGKIINQNTGEVQFAYINMDGNQAIQITFSNKGFVVYKEGTTSYDTN